MKPRTLLTDRLNPNHLRWEPIRCRAFERGHEHAMSAMLCAIHASPPPNEIVEQRQACKGDYRQVHSPLDYRAAFREEPAEPSAQLEALLAVRFDRGTVALLRKVAHAKGIGATTLLRLWTIERLKEELAPARKGVARRTA